jgi:hypothetical protein
LDYQAATVPTMVGGCRQRDDGGAVAVAAATDLKSEAHSAFLFDEGSDILW